MKFTPLLKLPEKGNPYYNTKSAGGYSDCIVGSPTVKGLNVLCNCVGFEVGRFNEISNKGKKVYFGSMNAKSFYPWAVKHGLPTGKTPKLGACICFSGGKDGLGHVASVEELDDKGNCTLVSSGYKSYEFKVQKNCNASNNYGMSKSYKFESFIYNPDLENSTIDDIKELLEDAKKLIDKAEEKLSEV